MGKTCGSHIVRIHLRYVIELDMVGTLLVEASTGRTCLEGNVLLVANSVDARAMLPPEPQLMGTPARTPTKVLKALSMLPPVLLEVPMTNEQRVKRGVVRQWPTKPKLCLTCPYEKKLLTLDLWPLKSGQLQRTYPSGEKIERKLREFG